MTEIYIDADACPVKDEVLRVAERHDLKIHVVCNTWMRRPDGPLVNKVVVADGPDVADDWIADHIGAHDICITGDIPLASRCLEKGAAVLGHTGNLLLASLSAFVHPLRLTFVEFYKNAAFEGGGKAFKPFRKRVPSIKVIPFNI